MNSLSQELPVDDLTLARRVAAGDELALAALYARYAGPLFAFVYHHLGERLESEEIWQDTWLAALRGIEAYRGQSRLFTWLCSIARHKIADAGRRRGRQLQQMTDTPIETLELAGGPLPEDVLARREVRLRVVQALAALPDDYRTALVARYADEHSVGEVAQLLGRPYKAAESLLSRAKAAFRSAFSPVEMKNGR